MGSKSGRIYMDASTIEYGKECPDCLRWFVSVFKDDPCPHCLKFGCPPYPNRVRYLAVKQGISLREISRTSKLEWCTIRKISQGRCAPHITTKRKILRALSSSVRRSELEYVFPYPRRRA